MSIPLLITGATGKQGRACITALLSSPSSPSYTILALTRTPTSPSALSLTRQSPSIKLIQGDLNDCPAIFAAASNATDRPIWGVFGVTTPMGGGEERQGKALVDAALAAGVKRFVFTSVERGGSEKSQTSPTDVPHFITKFNIEQHLQTRSAEASSGMSWTILRPVAFMDNLTPDFFGKIFSTAWKTALGDSTPLQLISSHDIGVFAAEAFLHPAEYRNRALSLATDELTYGQADEIFKSKTGGGCMPTTFGAVARLGLWASRDLGLMFRFFRDEGFGADVAEVRRMKPEVMGFGEWLERKSGFVKR